MRFAPLALLVTTLGCTVLDRGPVEPVAAPETALARVSTEVSSELTELRNAVIELNERLEVVNARLADAEARSEALASQLAARTEPTEGVSQATPAPVTGRPAASSSANEPVRSANLADDYARALAAHSKRQYPEARALLLSVYETEPDGDLADNALYWIGETFYASGDNREALKYYRKVVEQYAAENKAPDAMLKLGMIYVREGDLALARTTFETLIRQYPYSTPAAAARAQLERIQY